MSGKINYKRVWSPSDAGLTSRVSTLENNEYKITYFESVSAATGTITKPAQSTILLDQFFSGIDAYVSTIVNGQPTGILPQTSGGTPVDVSSFDALGNYTLTGTPSAFPVAIIYILKIKSIYYSNLNINNILDLEDFNTGSGGGISGLTTNELVYGNSATSIASLAVATYPSLTQLSYVKGVTSAIQTQLNSIGVTYPANTMKANNTASTAAPSTFTYKDIGEQTFAQTITWSTASPTGVSLKYRWFQIGNVVHFSFYLTSTVAATNSNVFWDHPSDMPTPVTFTGLTTTSNTYLFRYLSTVGLNLKAAPPTGWYGRIRKGSPVVSYNWFFSGTAVSILYIQVNGTYFTA